MEDLANSDISKDAAPYVSSDFDVAIAGLDGSFRCKADQSILGAMIAAGRRPIAVGCRSGGCGVCRMQVVKGTYTTGRMNRERTEGRRVGKEGVSTCKSGWGQKP